MVPPQKELTHKEPPIYEMACDSYQGQRRVQGSRKSASSRL
jgi:hypothetical protein